MADSQHMTFRRFGRAYHLKIETAEDLDRVLELDEALWVASGAPIHMINCDGTFLNLVDIDSNNRIMCFEVKDAIRWALRELSDRSGVTEGSTSLRLDAINVDDEDGQRIHLSATKILARLGRCDAQEITLDQVRQIKTAVESTPVSEAGVVLPEAADDAEIKQFIADVIATVGGAPHPSGSQGVGETQLDDFLTQAKAYLDWRAPGELCDSQETSDVMPLGTQTEPAYALCRTLRDKIDQYFAQCEAVALEPRAAQLIGPRDAELEAMDLDDPKAIEELMKNAPIARPGPDRTLSFDAQINAYYAEPLNALRTQVLEPLLGQPAPRLAESEWEHVKQRFAAHEAWISSKAGAAVESLGPEKLHTYLDGKFETAVRTLIAGSHETVFVMDNIRLTEKLILYQAYLLDLTNNFVSFPYLYDPGSRAMFEMGTLVMDGRHFNLAVKVDDRARHSALAKTSNMFVLYVEITPKQGGQKYELAVPVTSAGMGNLCVGKRGLFRDVTGQELDATVVQVIENPISIREAMISPFQRIGRVLTGKIEAMTTAAEKKLDTTVSQGITQVETAPAAAPAAPASKGLMAGGLLMGGGVAVAALGSSLVYVLDKLANAGPYKIIFGVLAAVLAVMLPTSIVAFLKLRSRDLSAILEGSGWAINSRMRLTFRQGRTFTRFPGFPKGSKGVHRKWLWVIVALLILAAGGFLGGYLGRARLRTRWTSPEKAPAVQPTPTNATATDQK